MHVFIDTNILLNFYHFTGDDLDALRSVFASHGKGSLSLHLTEQVRDELARNREGKIGDALKQFKAIGLPQIPHFMKTYPEYDDFRELGKTYEGLHRALLVRAESDIASRKFPADVLISEILGKSKLLATTPEVYQRARMRMDVGNPPGKNGSLGDAINWLLLLDGVPHGQPLHVITEDADFYSAVDRGRIGGFLVDEWQREKGATVSGYRSLTAFLKEHFEGVVLSMDPEKRELIDALETAGSFAAVHAVVAQLGEFDSFSLREATALLEAAKANSQLRWIVMDPDVRSLMRSALGPHRKKLAKQGHDELIAQVFGE